MKKTIRLNENELKHMIMESVKRVLNEEENITPEERFYRQLQGKIIEAGKHFCYNYECIDPPFELDPERLYNILRAAINEIHDFAFYIVGNRPSTDGYGKY